MNIACPFCGTFGPYKKNYDCSHCALRIKVSVPEDKKIKIEDAKKVTIVIEE
jgi:hypothetical protein